MAVDSSEAKVGTRVTPATAASASVDEYRLVRVLGRGARGDVVLAHDGALDRAVVLHFLPHDATLRAPLLDGARALARVSHPSLCPVYRIREGGDRDYIVQAFERGQRLDDIATPLPAERVRAIARALVGGLEALHAVGVAHGAVRAKGIVVSSVGLPRLIALSAARASSTAEARARDWVDLLDVLEAISDPETRELLGAVNPSRGGSVSAEALSRALGDAARARREEGAVATAPYAGLRPFETEQAPFFFGRQRDVADALRRLRAEPRLVVAGPSGAGKSSFVQAGVVPAVLGGGLGETGPWSVARMVPGSRPLRALSIALAPPLGLEAERLEGQLREAPLTAANLVRGRTGGGILVVLDQLEEAFTLADAPLRDELFAVLGHFAVLSPGVRLVATLRSDFLEHVGGLGVVGRDLLRATFVLPPMHADPLREAIAGPARACGFELESPAMVQTLLDQASANGGTDALPLLSFALAELWKERDVTRRIVPEEALARLGGVTEALSRHADWVFSSLSPDERREARRILLHLVTTSGTRSRATREALLAEGGASAHAALEALIHGRLVVADESYSLAHEALLRTWPRLRAWLDETSDARQIAARLVAAAREWQRLGGAGTELLWSRRQLGGLEASGAVAEADGTERAFVEASRAAIRAARVRRWAMALGSIALLALVGAGGVARESAAHRAAVARALGEARAFEVVVEGAASSATRARADALALFDRDDLEPAETLWKSALTMDEDLDQKRRSVCAALDRALALNPTDSDARALYADVVWSRLLAAEQRHDAALVRELRVRLDGVDDGTRAARLIAPAHVRVVTDPAPATLTLARFRDDAARGLIESEDKTVSTASSLALEPGSYLLVASAPERATTRYPFVVRRGEERTLTVALPKQADVPEGMIYVPGGRFSYGSSDDEATRAFFLHQPAHNVEIGSFLIARTEVTNGQYAVFLRALPSSERRVHLPRTLVLSPSGTVELSHAHSVLAPGQPYCSGAQPCVDWALLPVDEVSREDGESYAAWLAASGRLRGARLCTDREWERAARGADERVSPGGQTNLGPSDACTLDTYAGDFVGAGPCAVGTHPASASPFGVDDMTGSEWEWVSGPADIAQPKQGVTRGASYIDWGSYVSLLNRAIGTTQAAYADGLRICADAPLIRSCVTVHRGKEPVTEMQTRSPTVAEGAV